jgi:group I intron endonuclease
MFFNFIKSYKFPFNLELIKKDCFGKSGVYLILNTINNHFYIGSAISKSDIHNRLYIRFRNHFFNNIKSTNIYLRRSILKYGIQNFSFNILVFDVPDNIISLENFYINKFNPEYNILPTAFNSTGYKHSETTKLKMKNNFSLERRQLIGNLNKNKTLSNDTKHLMSQTMSLRHATGQIKISESFKMSKSRLTLVYDLNNNLLKKYNSAKEILKDYSVDYSTIRRHIKDGKPIKKLGIIIKYSL